MLIYSVGSDVTRMQRREITNHVESDKIRRGKKTAKSVNLNSFFKIVLSLIKKNME